jgi:hypothetical protein
VKALPEKISSFYPVFGRSFFHYFPHFCGENWLRESFDFCFVVIASGFRHPGSCEQILQGKSTIQDESFPELETPLQPRDKPANARPLNTTVRNPSFMNSRLLFILCASFIT